MNQATIALSQAQSTAFSNYSNFVSSTHSTETYTQWLANEGSAYSAGVTTAQQTLANAQNALSGYMASKNSVVQQAFASYKNGLSFVTSPINNQQVQVAGWATSEFAYNYVNTITNNNPGGPATAGNHMSFEVNQSSSYYDYQHAWGSSEAGFAWDFFLGEGEGSWSSTSTESFSSEYSLQFSFGDLSTIQVNPGSWYTPGLPSLLKNGPYYEGYSGFKSGGNTYFFGPPAGALERIITAMIVGYQPQVKITAGGSFAQTLQSQWEAEGGLVIGPFAFGAAGGGNSEQDTFSSDGATVTLTNKASWPYIVAFVSNLVAQPQQAAAASANPQALYHPRRLIRRA